MGSGNRPLLSVFRGSRPALSCTVEAAAAEDVSVGRGAADPFGGTDLVLAAASGRGGEGETRHRIVRGLWHGSH